MNSHRTTQMAFVLGGLLGQETNMGHMAQMLPGMGI